MMFSLLKEHAEEGWEIGGDGVLEVLQDGFGFLRAARRPTICPARTTSMSRPDILRQFSACAPATPSKGVIAGTEREREVFLHDQGHADQL